MAKHILIVDDSKTVRNLVAFIMKKEGFKVTAAEDGLDGLEKLYSEQKIDLIISDINMPRMDGITFIKTVREQDAYRDIPNAVLYLDCERISPAGWDIPLHLVHTNDLDPARGFVAETTI